LNLGDIKEHLEALYKASIGIILDRLERGIRERKNFDKRLYKKIIEIISPEIMRDFFSELGINQFWNYHVRKIDTYLDHILIPGKKFLDKKIQTAKETFDKSLQELQLFISTEFFYSDHIENLFLLQPELEKRVWNHDEGTMRYDELVQQLRILQKNTERSYESFVRIAQKRLHI